MNTANLRLRDRWLLALFASLFLTVGASAQNEVEIQGRVTADGQPLVGASVIIKGTTTGTSTDIAGNFTVRAKNGAVLSVGFVGYKTREVAVTAGVTFLDIVLEAEEALIDDVVVIGYGSMKKSDLTGSVVSVKMDAIKDISAPSIEGLLQGRAAGLQIMNTSQDPGAGAVVRIRGNSSLNGSNTPLIVVDGFPIGDAGNLSQINPSDIESIEILKDASSSAIYGSQRRDPDPDPHRQRRVDSGFGEPPDHHRAVHRQTQRLAQPAANGADRQRGADQRRAAGPLHRSVQQRHLLSVTHRDPTGQVVEHRLGRPLHAYGRGQQYDGHAVALHRQGGDQSEP